MDRLIIIDSYIFPKKYDEDYPNLFIDIVRKYIPKIRDLIFITNDKYNQELQERIFNLIRQINPLITIELLINDSFHDRFWLSDPKNKGFFMGTSLNGLGKKYTLLDYINSTDVNTLFEQLKTENLMQII